MLSNRVLQFLREIDEPKFKNFMNLGQQWKCTVEVFDENEEIYFTAKNDDLAVCEIDEALHRITEGKMPWGWLMSKWENDWFTSSKRK